MKTSSEFAQFDSSRYFPALDGLRAFSVFLVMFNHVHVAIPSWLHGQLGVDVFFVLSGFLITTLLMRERAATGRVSLSAFYIRRVFRIIPVYLAVVGLYAVALKVSHDTVRQIEFRAALPYLLSFLQEYRPGSTGTVLGHAWTLGIEEKFYLFWPLLMVLLYPFRRPQWIALFVVFALILFLPHEFQRSYDGLLMGAALAIALSPGSPRRVASALRKLPSGLIYAAVIGGYVAYTWNTEAILLFSAGIALWVASLVLRESGVRKILESPALVYIGKRSYGMYLVHVLVINTVERMPARFVPHHWVPIIVLSYVGSLAVAAVLHVAIETPCIAWGRRLSRSVAGPKVAPLADEGTSVPIHRPND